MGVSAGAVEVVVLTRGLSRFCLGFRVCVEAVVASVVVASVAAASVVAGGVSVPGLTC